MLWTWKWRKFKRTLNICFFHLSAKSSECVDATAKNWSLNSVQFNQSCPALCDPTDYSMPGFPAHHQLPELAQTHVHWVVMTSSHFILYCPLLFLPSIFPSIRGFSNESVLCISWPKYWNFSFSVSVLPMNIQDWLPLGLSGWISLQSRELSRVFCNTTVQKHQFFGAQPSSQSNSHIHTWPQEKP